MNSKWFVSPGIISTNHSNVVFEPEELCGVSTSKCLEFFSDAILRRVSAARCVDSDKFPAPYFTSFANSGSCALQEECLVKFKAGSLSSCILFLSAAKVIDANNKSSSVVLNTRPGFLLACDFLLEITFLTSFFVGLLKLEAFE